MEKFFLTITFLIPIIGLFSALSVATTVPLFAFASLVHLRKSLEFDIKKYKLEIIFILWILASCFWSLNFTNSFFSSISFSTEFLIGLILIKNIAKIDISPKKTEKILVASFFVSSAVFFLEYLTDGKISLLFREFTQKKESHIFFLHNLDRGVALLTLLSWVIIGAFLRKEKKIFAGIIYCILLVVLVFSDNLAAFIAHIIAAIVFLVTRFTIIRNPKILCFLFLICSILMIIFAFKINPFELSKEYQTLPFSAKHRLFIWNFVAENSKNHPILGIGFNSSKTFPIEDDQIISLFGNELHPLPMHPHNNIMQVYFELGIIGLILYLSLACKYILIIGRDYTTKNQVKKDLICASYSCFSVYFIIAMISYNMWQSWFVAAIIWIVTLLAMRDNH